MTPRIALVFPGDPLRAKTWSGTPAGVAAGLEQVGTEVVPIRAEPPAPIADLARNLVAARYLRSSRESGAAAAIRFARLVARASPALGTVQGVAARVKLRRAGRIDGIVQVGTGFVLPEGTPFVTLEDTTVPQAVSVGYPELRALSPRTLGVRMERQRAAYERAVGCCLTSAWAARSVVDDYGIPPEKVHVVGIGRNHEPRPGDHDWTRPSFLWVGKDWEGKSGPAVLRAFESVRRKVPQARLDVVGNHPPLDVPGAVGHGFLHLDAPADRRRLAELYEAATCFVMPSRYEAAGLVYIEAAVGGLPSIGTTVGGAADLIGDAGRVVDPSDDDALLAAMLDLCDPHLAASLGAKALHRAELFTWRKVAERILRALALPGVPRDGLADFL